MTTISSIYHPLNSTLKAEPDTEKAESGGAPGLRVLLLLPSLSVTFADISRQKVKL